MQYYFLILGIAILVACKIFEQRHRTTKAYINFKNYILTSDQSWKAISNEIIQTHRNRSIEIILEKKVDIYLIEKKEYEIKIYSLNNKKVKNISEFQYNSILKKFEKQDMFYTFNIDAGSIYYRFNPPHETYILWIYTSTF